MRLLGLCAGLAWTFASESFFVCMCSPTGALHTPRIYLTSVPLSATVSQSGTPHRPWFRAPDPKGHVTGSEHG